jgi:hypothetical protein
MLEKGPFCVGIISFGSENRDVVSQLGNRAHLT